MYFARRAGKLRAGADPEGLWPAPDAKNTETGNNPDFVIPAQQQIGFAAFGVMDCCRAICACRRRHGFQTADTQQRQIPRHGQPLRHTAGHAQTGERPRPGPERHALQIGKAQPLRTQKCSRHRQQGSGIRQISRASPRQHDAIQPERHGTGIDGCFKCKDFHRAHFTGTREGGRDRAIA